MNEILKQLQAKIDLLLGTLAGSITVTQTYYINGLFERLSPTGGVAFYGGGDSWGSNYDAFTD
jgi:hypothetical protein